MKNRRLTKNNHIRFWFLLGILMLFITLRYAFQIEIPKVLFLGIMGLIVLLGDQDEIIAAYICCVSLHESIDFFYTLVIITAVYVLKYYKHLRIGKNILLVLLIIIWELVHCFASGFSVRTFIVNVIPFIVLAVIMATEVENLDYAFVVRAFSWTTFAVILMMFIRVLYFSNFNVAHAMTNLHRLGSDNHSGIDGVSVEGGQIHPNAVGTITVLASTGLMQLRSMGGGKRSDLVLMCSMLVLAALTTSRTYLACLLMMIFLLILAVKGGFAKKVRMFAILILAVVAVVTVFALFFPSVFEYYISRFLVSDITTGRDDLMERYHHFIMRNPNVLFLGIGLQDFDGRLIEYYRIAENVPHNSIQELIIAWGLPGVILFAALILTMSGVSKRHCAKQGLINYIPLLIILFKGMAGQMLNSAYTMLAFSYAYLSMCADLSPRDEQRIFTRTQTIPRGSGHNINQSSERTKKR